MNSWVQIDKPTQSLFGLAVEPFWQGQGSTSFFILAADVDENSVATELVIKVASTNTLRVSHTFNMKILTDYTLFTSELEHTIWWLGNVTRYFNSDLSSVTLISLSEGSVIVSWSNNSINQIDPPYICPGSQIYQQYRIVNGGGLVNSLPQYLILSIDLKLQGICSDYTTTTEVPTTTSTISTTSSPTTSTVPTTTTTPTTTSKYMATFSFVNQTHNNSSETGSLCKHFLSRLFSACL